MTNRSRAIKEEKGKGGKTEEKGKERPARNTWRRGKGRAEQLAN